MTDAIERGELPAFRRMTPRDEKTAAEITAAWIDGFTACAALFSGDREYYEARRDEYLARKGWKPPALPTPRPEGETGRG